MKRSLFVAAVLLVAVPIAAAQSPQPSGQGQLATPPPNPAKSPPLAQAAPMPVYQMPAPVVAPTIVMMAQPAVPAAQAMLVASPKLPRTIQWGPTPVGVGLAWVGRRLEGFGKAHTWTINHTVFSPVLIAPSPAPSVFVATQPAPAFTYQLVPVPGPVATPPVQMPTAYYATPSTPPAGSTPPPPMMRSEAAPPPPAPPKPTPSAQTGSTTATRDRDVTKLGALLDIEELER